MEEKKNQQNHLFHSKSGTEENQTLHLSECPKCGGSGYYRVLEGDIWYAVECPCGIRKKRILEKQLKFAKIPEMYKDACFGNMRSSVYKLSESKTIFFQAAEMVKTWFDDFEEMQNIGMGLYLYSSTKGSGKTKTACMLANEIMKKYPEKIVKFSTQPEIKAEIKKSWDREKSAEEKLIEEMVNAEILIIDDFGASASKDWINEKFYEIINGRYVKQNITIFTSNCSISQLDCDDRITNRILERSYEIPFPEESVRENIAEENKQKLIEKIKYANRG